MITGQMWNLLSDEELERINAAALRLLTETGARVEDAEVRQQLAARGCPVDGVDHGRFTRPLIREALEHFARVEAARRPAGADPWRVSWPTGWQSGRSRSLWLGGSYPHLLDWPSGVRRLATRQDVCDIIKMGHVLDEIGGVGQSFITVDADPRYEPVWNAATRIMMTDKPIGGGEVIYAENVKHLVRLGEIATGRPGETGLVASCNFLISPLRYTARMITNIREKMKFRIPDLIGSMPVSGMSGPVTVAGTAALMLAEMIGGFVISYVMDPEIAIGGIVASGSLDMRTTQALFGTPEAMLQDVTVIHALRRLHGLNSTYSAFGYVDCKKPGIRAVFEKLLPMAAMPLSLSVNFGPSGLLNAGQDYSPVQHLLELDFSQAAHRLLGGFAVTPETLAEDLMAEVIKSPTPNFLATEHTLHHYATEQWYPQWLDRTAWRGTATELAEEGDMLDRIDHYWKAAVARYQPPAIDPAKIKAAQEVLRAAEQEAPHVRLLM